MGFYFRRGKKVGPFNFTVSKSGIGTSVGAGPFRVSRGATGRKSFTARSGIPGFGFRKYFK